MNEPGRLQDLEAAVREIGDSAPNSAYLRRERDRHLAALPGYEAQVLDPGMRLGVCFTL